MTLRNDVHARLTDLRQRAADGAAALSRLHEAPSTAWPDRIAADDALHEVMTLHGILDHVMKVELFRDANTALRITTAILALPLDDVVVRGRALRLRAHALHRKGKGAQSRHTLGEAMTVLATEPAGALELLHARLFNAYLRNETQEGDVLLEVRVIAKTFAAHGDARGTLQACLMEAAILHDRREFARAIIVNQNAASIASSLHDEQNEAIAWNNAGQCAEQLAFLAHEEGVPLRAHASAEEALSYFARATPRYASLKMDAESQKILWAMASLARQFGDLEDAREKLLSVRAALLEHGMFLSAALVALDLIELLIMGNRTDLAVSWYDEAVHTFAAAGMPRYALRALERVRAAAQTGSIDARLLAAVRADVRDEFERAA